MFDSHIRRLLTASVDLVNALTDGHAHGRPYRAPREEAAADAVLTALSLPPDAALDASETAYLSATAHQLRRIYEAVSADDLDGAASMINTALRSTGARPQLDRAPGEPWQLHFHGADDSLGVGWSAGCVAAVALAAGSDLAGRLGVCQADRCDRVYVDTSRNAGRQFCSTACQNRAKAATFRARQVSVDRA
jgi:predicted RNA-binding Zn ribbon-like protein